jgi:putative membrane protein
MARTMKASLASVAALSMAAFAPLSTAAAQQGDAVITNTETVNVSLDPSGDPDGALVYDQIAIQGTGSVAYENPVSTAGLRNLDTFGGFTVEGDSIVEETEVDGQVRRRSVSDFELDLPVSVSVVYRLDGQEIPPADLVGKSGEVDVSYRIENMTGAEEEITVLDGQGNEVTKSVTVYDPFAGTLSFTLPPNYTDVVSDSGFVPAGDGRGGTLMNLSVTLISGLTEPVVEAGYTARVKDAVVPPASLSVVPVLVQENPSSAAQLEALQGGAATGRELASNGALLDESVLQLADGAATLVNGILQLNAGAAELSDGLVNTAAPGSAELAAGAGELAAGLNDTAVPGAQRLAAGLNGTAVPGAQRLAAGLNGTAVPGSQDLADGATVLAGGLLALDAQVPTLADGIIRLDEGANQVEAGLKQLQAQVPSLTSGVVALSDGADQVEAGLKQLQSQIPALTQGVNQLAAGSQQLAGGLNQLETALDAPLPSGFGAGLDNLATSLAAAAGAGGLADQVIVGIGQITGSPDCGPICQGTASAVSGDVNTNLRGQVQAAADGAVALNQGYTTQIRPTIEQLSSGAGDLANGLDQLQSQLGPLSDGVDQLVDGAAQVAAGLRQLEGNVGPLADGIDQLTDGATQVSNGLAQLRANVDPLAGGVEQLAAGGLLVAGGATELADGLVEAGDGSRELADGLVEAGDGSQELADGLVGAGDGANQVADGAGQLADGLGDAAAGSVRLADGLSDAAEAAPALPAGAQRLSAEGTSLLVEAGDQTALSFGERVAVLEASAERTADGGLPFGGPQDAIVAAAYRYDLAAATGATAQNTGRLVAGVAIAGAAAVGAGVLARRKTA